MYTTGYHKQFVDDKYGISFEDIENLSMRHQRDIIKQRAK